VGALKDAGFSGCSQQEWFNGLLRDYRAVREEGTGGGL
jgi:hypothetical protein